MPFLCSGEEDKKYILVGNYGCNGCPTDVGYHLHCITKPAMSPSQRHLGVLGGERMLRLNQGNVEFSKYSSHHGHCNGIASTTNYLALALEPAEKDRHCPDFQCRDPVSTSPYHSPLVNKVDNRSASVAACFRLAHTVAFSKEADTMWYIGPLLFWACAEMTCGFFILAVMSVPAIVKAFKCFGHHNMGEEETSPSAHDDDWVPLTTLDSFQVPGQTKEQQQTHLERGNGVYVTRTFVVQIDPNSESIPNSAVLDSNPQHGFSAGY